ncbi:MAG: aminotransferase class I/II-fold pyridoxal phosphate-dependent enzyme [Treponema sp.]|nr:aminotransferase class I/II-fold pyridoxal phosphate-dependent enzyme [Treponema sp.]
MLNPLAQELNGILKNSSASFLFSDFGERIYFPNGIIAQSGEAKKFGYTANGTIGTTIIDGRPAMLDAIHRHVPEFSSASLVGYAPTAGNPDLREAWRQDMIRKNPSLEFKEFSQPVLVPGLTAGISYVADLFFDQTKPLLAADPSWDNYALICEARRNAPFHQFRMFNDGKFDIDSLEAALRKECEANKSTRLLLNFPQNPSGYSPTRAEAKKIVSILKELAEAGNKILCISDDAYFGLNYDDDIEPESLFAQTCDLHPNILAVKIDGPTKEDFVWGFRAGFVTFGCKGFSKEQYQALVTKLMGTIRSSVSCSSTPPQSFLLKAMTDESEEFEEQKLEYRAVLEERYKKVRAFVDSHSSKVIEPLPFNSGYFMSFAVKGKDAEELRQKLLHGCGIGTVSIDSKTLRVAFSSLEAEQIEEVYSSIYKIADEL